MICQRQTFGQDGAEVLPKFIITTALEIPASLTPPESSFMLRGAKA